MPIYSTNLSLYIAIIIIYARMPITYDFGHLAAKLQNKFSGYADFQCRNIKMGNNCIPGV